MRYVIALKDGENGVEKNWVYRVVGRTNTTYTVVEEFIGPDKHFMTENKSIFGMVTEEEYKHLEQLAEEDRVEEQDKLWSEIMKREEAFQKQYDMYNTWKLPRS